MMKNGVYFIVIALLVAELFVDTKLCNITKDGVSPKIFSV